MTTPHDDDLEAREGVNEGSAAATGEGASSGERAPGVEGGALTAASETGRPKGEYDPAPPLPTNPPLTRTDDPDEQAAPGQETQVGEG